MKIYTKTGDQGQTGLWGGSRIPKDHPRVMAYGDVDELNSCLGAAMGTLSGDNKVSKLMPWLEKIQAELFIIGALLATPKDKLSRIEAPFKNGLPADTISRLEAEIDALTQELKPMDRFILPGGGPAGAWFHLARTVCRRAERSAVTLAAQEDLPANILVYLNRLSDHLFTMARWVNAKQSRSETVWEGLKAD